MQFPYVGRYIFFLALSAPGACGNVRFPDVTDPSPPGVSMLVSGIAGQTLAIETGDAARTVNTAGVSGIVIDALASDADTGLNHLTLSVDAHFMCGDPVTMTSIAGPRGGSKTVTKFPPVPKTFNQDKKSDARAANGGLPTARVVRLELGTVGCAKGSKPVGGMNVVVSAEAQNGAGRTATTGKLTIQSRGFR